MPVEPLPRGDVWRIGAASLALLAGGFFPCFSPYAGQVAENSYGVHEPLRDRLDGAAWHDLHEARHRARDLQDWPSRYNAIAVVHAEMRLDEEVRIRLGVLRNSVDYAQVRAFETLFLVGLLPSFVYGGLLSGWAGLRLFWRGHAALDATMLSTGLFLGIVDTITLVALRMVRQGLYVSPTWIYFLIVPAIGLTAASYLSARRAGYRRVLVSAATLLALFFWIQRFLALEAGAIRT